MSPDSIHALDPYRRVAERVKGDLYNIATVLFLLSSLVDPPQTITALFLLNPLPVAFDMQRELTDPDSLETDQDPNPAPFFLGQRVLALLVNGVFLRLAKWKLPGEDRRSVFTKTQYDAAKDMYTLLLLLNAFLDTEPHPTQGSRCGRLQLPRSPSQHLGDLAPVARRHLAAAIPVSAGGLACWCQRGADEQPIWTRLRDQLYDNDCECESRSHLTHIKEGVVRAVLLNNVGWLSRGYVDRDAEGTGLRGGQRRIILGKRRDKLCLLLGFLQPFPPPWHQDTWRARAP